MTPRERLVEAMTAVAARHGYAEASVARVVKQAGMSRATFYEHFEDRDDCFLAAFRRAAAPVRRELDRAGERGPSSRPREVIELLLGAADADPAAAQLVLIEAMAGGDAVCAAHEELLAETEAAIDRYLDAAAPGEPQLEIPTRALLGGIANLVAMRVFRHEGGLAGLGDDLVAWLESYALPPGRERLRHEQWIELGEAWAQLGYRPLSASSARVVSGIAPTERDGEQRQRVIEGIARCSREQSYSETTVADVVAAAGVSKASFYERFRNKEDAYLAAQAHGLEGAAAIAAARFFNEAPWPERIWNAIDGLLEYIAERPNLTHMQMIDSYRVGRAAIRRSFENRMAFTVFVEDGYRQRPEAEAMPRICSEAIAGASEELFRHQAARGMTERARELVPQSAYVSLAPFIGADAALEFVRERCRTAA